MAEKALKTIQTAVGFIPPPYGLVFQATFGIYAFAIGFGRPDPIEAAIERIQKQIDQIKERLAHLDSRLNEINGRIAEIENRAVRARLQDINREAERIVFALSQRPTDGFARRMIAFDAQALADRFLKEPEIWHWTDVEVTAIFDENDNPLRVEEKALDPDFKLTLALPAYFDAVFLWIAAIDLVTAGDSPTVRQLFGEALIRHVEANLTREDWTDNSGQPPVTLAEQVRARIGSEVFVQHKNADKSGVCTYGIVANNRMDHHRYEVGVTSSFMVGGGQPGFPILCTWPPSMPAPYEEMAEDDYGVSAMADLAEALKKVYYSGSLRQPYIGKFVMAPAPVPAYILGITPEGGVDWYFQTVDNGPTNWDGPRRTREGWGDYIRMIPAGGGRFYGLAPNGDLDWFRHAPTDWQSGGTNWTGPKTVGTGWGHFARIVPAGYGILYAIQTDGKALWYRHDGVKNGGDEWRGPIEVGTGFEDYLRVFSVGDGVLYGVRGNGDLIWHCHEGWDDGAVAWTPSRQVGTSWQTFRDVFGSWEGAIYAVRPDGQVLRYIHDDWKTGGQGWTEPALVAFGGYRQIVADMSETFVGPN